MKKLFALFALCLCLTMVVSCDKQETEDTTPSETQETESMLSDYTEGLAFELRNGSYAVIGYTGDTEDVVIPEKYDGVSVTSIANYAFFNASHLTSVSIPDGITTIENYAFKGCTALKTFTISDKVEQVGVATFEGCDSLENITVPFLGYNKTAENGTLKYLFGNNIPSSLKTVTVTGGTVLSKEAFSNCNYLTKINLPDTLKVIGEKAFYGCTGLTELVIPANVTDIGENAFNGCTGIKEIIIPAKVLKIGRGAFSNCSALTSVTISDSVQEIERLAFVNCTSLTEMVIPDTVQIIGEQIFMGCDSLEKITVPFLGNKMSNNSSSTHKILGYFFNYTTPSGTNVYDSINDLSDIPSSLKKVVITLDQMVEDEAFEGCKYLTDITLPSSIKTIGKKAFYGCTGLTELVIPANVTDIGENAFNGCTGIKEIIIPAKVLKIGRGAFSNCSALTSVTISDSVQEIERLAFVNCTSLTEMVIPDTVQIIGDKIFMGCDSLEKITVPFLGNKKSNNSSSTHKILGYFFNYTHPSGTNIYDSINDLSDIPSSLKEVVITLDQMVEDEAFEGCKYLTNITLPSGVKTIGKKAFYGCTSLKNVTFGGSMDDWANITRGALWNGGLDACKIVCSDGEIAAQE